MSQHNKHKPIHKPVSVDTAEPAPEQQPDRKLANPAPTDAAPATNPNWKIVLKIPTLDHEKASIPMTKNYEEFASINKEAVDAFAQSGSIFAKGFEEISRQVLALTQTSVETNIATGKAAMGVKTLKELLDLQSDWMRHVFDTAFTQATQLSQLSVKVANQVAEPIQSHFTSAFSKMGNDPSKAA